MSTSSPAPLGAPAGRPRPAPRVALVRAIEVLSPHMRRITFEGPELATFAWSGPASHIKLISPAPGSDVAEIPVPDGPRPARARTYTPRRFDAAARSLVVDFVLHGTGPASIWAAGAKPGQQVTIMGPGRSYEVDAEAAWYVIAGDQCAIPAIETILEALPAQMRVFVFVEITDRAEERPIAVSPQTSVGWFVRDEDDVPGLRLEAALERFVWPEGAGRVYAGCESNAVRRVRALALAKSGLDGSRIVTRGYWRTGVENNPDGDYAQD